MSEIRFDLITGKMVIIAVERAKRPHDFVIAHQEKKGSKNCPFCPGNEAMTPPALIEIKDKKGKWLVRGFPNKFGALNREEKEIEVPALYKAEYGYGVAEVIVESPYHDVTFGGLSVEQIKMVFHAIVERYKAIAEDKKIKYIQVFKNFGPRGGASLEHGHWQIIGTPFVPDLVNKEIEGTQDYIKKERKCPYCEIVQYEKEAGVRLIGENEYFLAIAPYASQYPYESWIIPKIHQEKFEDLDEKHLSGLAEILKPLIEKYEKEFDMPPYNIVLHTLPPEDLRNYHWHLEIAPRLTIAAGFELGTGVYINPVAPELAASVLKIDVLQPARKEVV
ncbi:galactose-1-phosphate uridylyltransferase [Caldanaerobacter sp.]|uniref:galactose-1-phosphate uridylyltransferase n=1 Tax=Caldanaerobacter sp. TaxID=2930036 RepID=UPI003C77A8C1